MIALKTMVPTSGPLQNGVVVIVDVKVVVPELVAETLALEVAVLERVLVAVDVWVTEIVDEPVLD